MLAYLLNNLVKSSELDLEIKSNSTVDSMNFYNYYAILYLPTSSFLSINNKIIVFYDESTAKKLCSTFCTSNFLLGVPKTTLDIHEASLESLSEESEIQFEVVTIDLLENTEYYFCS